MLISGTPQILVLAFLLCAVSATGATLKNSLSRRVCLLASVLASLALIPALQKLDHNQAMLLLPLTLSLTLYIIFSGYRQSMEKEQGDLQGKVLKLQQDALGTQAQVEELKSRNQALLRLTSRKVSDEDLNRAVEHLLKAASRETFLNELARVAVLVCRVPHAACFVLEKDKLIRTGGIAADLPSILNPEDGPTQRALITHQAALIDLANPKGWQMACGIPEQVSTRLVLAIGGLNFQEVEAVRSETLETLCALAGRLIPSPETKPPEA